MLIMAAKRLRAIRISDELWQAAQAEAEKRGETLTEAIERALRRYSKTTTRPAK